MSNHNLSCKWKDRQGCCLMYNSFCLFDLNLDKSGKENRKLQLWENCSDYEIEEED